MIVFFKGQVLHWSTALRGRREEFIAAKCRALVIHRSGERFVVNDSLTSYKAKFTPSPRQWRYICPGSLVQLSFTLRPHKPVRNIFIFSLQTQQKCLPIPVDTTAKSEEWVEAHNNLRKGEGSSSMEKMVNSATFSVFSLITPTREVGS